MPPIVASVLLLPPATDSRPCNGDLIRYVANDTFNPQERFEIFEPGNQQIIPGISEIVRMALVCREPIMSGDWYVKEMREPGSRHRKYEVLKARNDSECPYVYGFEGILYHKLVAIYDGWAGMASITAQHQLEFALSPYLTCVVEVIDTPGHFEKRFNKQVKIFKKNNIWNLMVTTPKTIPLSELFVKYDKSLGFIVFTAIYECSSLFPPGSSPDAINASIDIHNFERWLRDNKWLYAEPDLFIKVGVGSYQDSVSLWHMYLKETYLDEFLNG